VNFIKELSVFGKWFSLVGIIYCYEIANGTGHLTTLEQFSIFTRSSGMILILESTTTENSVETQRIEGCCIFRGTRGVLRWDFRQ
jgi:hypothetical protein